MNSKNLIVAVVVALLVSSGVYAAGPSIKSAFSSDALGAASSGAVRNVPDQYTNGVIIGDQVDLAKTIYIGPGKNQGAWKNTTGRPIVIQRTDLGWISGTASSSYLYYVATSSTPTIPDYVRPVGTPLALDGAFTATGTPARTFVVGSSSPVAQSMVLPDGAYIVFNIQERYSCKTVGSCETATSTNRGVPTFLGFFTAHYLP